MQNNRTMRFTDYIVYVSAVILTEFLGWRYVGPLSIRNLGILLVIAFLIYRGWKYDSRLFRSFKYLIFYFAFIAILGFFNGLYIDSGTTLVFARFLPTIVLFCLTLHIIQDDSSMSHVIFFLLVLMAFDAVVTILQGIGNPIGWACYSFFQNPELESEYGDIDSSIGYSIASGINGSVVGNGFFLTVLGLYFWYPYYKKQTIISFFFSLVLSLLCIIALFYNQQRLSFYVYIFFVIFTLFYFLPYNGKVLPVLSLVIFSVLFVVWGLDFISSLDAGRLANVTNDDITERHIAHQRFYHDFLPVHFLTGDRHEFINMYGQTPHNFIIETLLLGGIGGFLIFFLFILSFCKRCLKSYKRSSMLFALQSIAILLISWEHSTGFHTGMTLGAYVFAIYEKSQQIYNH